MRSGWVILEKAPPNVGWIVLVKNRPNVGWWIVFCEKPALFGVGWVLFGKKQTHRVLDNFGKKPALFGVGWVLFGKNRPIGCWIKN